MAVVDDAKDALVSFEASMIEGHPWVPGKSFRSNPGLDHHILMALREFVRLAEQAEFSKPTRRVSLSEEVSSGQNDGQRAS